MPIYEYQCKACGHRLEVLQKMSEDALTDCPVCAQSTLTKLVSAAAFRLKGQGWYETDFKNSNQKGLAGDNASGAEQSTEKTATDSTDSSQSADSSAGSTSEKATEKTTEKNSSSPPVASTPASTSSSTE